MSWQNTPYTIRHNTTWFPFGCVQINRTVYELCFEDTPIRTISDYELASDICSLLNAAWNVGYANGKMHTELDLESKTEHDYKK